MKNLYLAILLSIPMVLAAQVTSKSGGNKMIQDILKQMTLEEKASLCSGRDFWTTKPIDRLNIPSIWMTDGPHGLRKATASAGFGEKIIPATCFPSASSLAASWDVNLIEEMGKAIGDECQANQVQIILGPGVNMKRSPLCGRNFEYYAEDPILAGEIAAAFINGVQSKGVGTSLKHFACNNQETERMVVSAQIDERTFREIYLRAFEIAVTKAQPWTVMSSYNRINGVYSSENPYLLNDILRNEWGFQGIVVSDWGAVNNRVDGIKARMNLEMPGSGGTTDAQIVEAVKQGKLAEADLDAVVADILKITFKAVSLKKPDATYNQQQHHLLARKIASECIVLLKNNDNILPLNKSKLKNVAIIGSFAKTPRFNGGGSASLSPTQTDIPYDEIAKIAGNAVQLTYSEGYPDNDAIDDAMITNAVNNAKTADVAVIFAGLPPSYESEGYDRKHINMPPNHIKLIEAVANANKNVVVVLNNGSAVAMPWLPNVKAVVEGGLAGQASGGAIADVLFGVVNPSGKLNETYPVALQDNPSYFNFPGENHTVNYGEGIFIGYRYYEARNRLPLFPFGYGLSYTTFAYSGIKVSAKNVNDTSQLQVSIKVKNTGAVAGQEIVQLYVSDKECSYQRPNKELKAFKKIMLKPGEEKEVAFTLGYRDYAFYNPALKQWVVESGDFDILVGASSQDIKQKETIHVTGTKKITEKLTTYSSIHQWFEHPKGKALIQPVFEGMVTGMTGGDKAPQETLDMMAKMLAEMPIIKMVGFSRGKFTEQMLDDMIKKANE
jgi:beta-glucosidase